MDEEPAFDVERCGELPDLPPLPEIPLIEDACVPDPPARGIFRHEGPFEADLPLGGGSAGTGGGGGGGSGLIHGLLTAAITPAGSGGDPAGSGTLQPRDSAWNPAGPAVTLTVRSSVMFAPAGAYCVAAYVNGIATPIYVDP